MLFINFKTYPKATGEAAVNLASICHEVAEETGVKIAIALQPSDIFRVAQQIKIPIFSQHCDPASPGRHTGSITALALKKAGASGVFLNHSEHNFFSFPDLGFSIDMAKEQELETLVFVKDMKIALKVDQFKPTFIALEEPSLISTGIGMVQLPENFKLIREFVSSIKAVPLIGAGVKTREDVFNSLKLGIKGIVLASGFVNAENPKQVLQSLCSAFRSQ